MQQVTLVTCQSKLCPLLVISVGKADGLNTTDAHHSTRHTGITETQQATEMTPHRSAHVQFVLHVYCKGFASMSYFLYIF